jgi:hypothetical protein
MISPRRFALLCVLAISMIACRSSEGALAVACQNIAVVRQIATELRAGLLAARHSDDAAMTAAGGTARALAGRLLDALPVLGPQSSPEPLHLSLLSVGLFGDQGGLFLSGGTPTEEGLVTLEANLPKLDEQVDTIESSVGQC